MRGWLAVALLAEAWAQEDVVEGLPPEATMSYLSAFTLLLEGAVLTAGIVVLGGGAFLWWRSRRHGYAPRARTGSLLRRLQLLKRVTVGGVLVDTPPLRSPLGELDCLAWRIQVHVCWWHEEEARQLLIHEQTEVTTLRLDDGSGPVVVRPATGDELEWVPSYDREREWSLLNAVLGLPPDVVPGLAVDIPEHHRAQLPERIEAIRRVEHVLPVSHRYVATGEPAPDGGLAGGERGPLVLVRDQLPPVLWVGRLVAERAMMIGALVLAVGTLVGLWLGAG